jgi:hypothetical protein
MARARRPPCGIDSHVKIPGLIDPLLKVLGRRDKRLGLCRSSTFKAVRCVNPNQCSEDNANSLYGLVPGGGWVAWWSVLCLGLKDNGPGDALPRSRGKQRAATVG